MSAPRLVAFNRAKPWLETMDQGASTVLIVGERSKVITVSKTGEYKKPPMGYDLPPPPMVPPRIYPLANPY